MNQQTHSATGHARSAAPITVLLVDDHPFIGLALGRLLATESDIRLHCCETAADAVSQANTIQPTIILQDLIMPGINGLDLVERFRLNAATAHTPIIVLSANEDSDSRARALGAGANDYVLKLPAKDVLIACIRAHATGRHAGEPVAPEHAGLTDEVSVCLTLDRDVMALFCEPNGELSTFARALIAQFLGDAESQLATMRDAVGSGSGELLRMTAHSLKGSSLTVGAKRLGALCRLVESERSAEAEWPQLIAALDEEFVHVRNAFGDL